MVSPNPGGFSDALFPRYWLHLFNQPANGIYRASGYEFFEMLSRGFFCSVIRI